MSSILRLKLLHTLFFTIRDHARLVSTVQQHISWPAGSFLDRAVDEAAQFERHQRYRSDRDQKQERRDPLPFVEDSEPDANGGFTRLYNQEQTKLPHVLC